MEEIKRAPLLPQVVVYNLGVAQKMMQKGCQVVWVENNRREGCEREVVVKFLDDAEGKTRRLMYELFDELKKRREEYLKQINESY